MIPLRFCARVWVPTACASLPEVQRELEALTAEFGGCTRIAGQGEWLSRKGKYVSEPVRIYEWWGDRVPITKQLILSLFRAGEESVMVQVDGAALLMFPHDYNLTTKENHE